MDERVSILDQGLGYFDKLLNFGGTVFSQIQEKELAEAQIQAEILQNQQNNTGTLYHSLAFSNPDILDSNIGQFVTKNPLIALGGAAGLGLIAYLALKG